MILRSRFLLAEDLSFVEGESLRLDGDRIVERGRDLAPRDGERVIDLGDAVALPGWINAHAHLELSRLQGLLPREVGFVPWVEELVRLRREQGIEWFDAAIDEGWSASVDAGTTLLGEVTTTGRTADRLPKSGATAYLFEEAIAFDPARAEEVARTIVDRVEGIPADDPVRRRAVAPHAPYTVSDVLFRRLADYAGWRGIPISVHVSETPDELRMFASGDGPLFEFLSGLGEIPSGWTPPRATPIEVLDSIGFLEARPLLVHANYLSDSDIARIRRAGATVIFCPRSHRFFGHRAHPFERLRAAGIPVALGTDSLASNDSLCMLAEVRELARQFPDLPTSELWYSAFRAGAHAFGLDSEAGRLAPGARADVVAYAPASRPADGADAESWLLEGAELPDWVMARGEVLRARGSLSDLQ